MQLAIIVSSLSLVPASAIDCSGPLATTQSSHDSSCPDTGLYHHWPVGGRASDCHGWRATAGGRTHDNSAKNIRFSDDAKTLLYDQYPMSVNCSGSPHSKSYVLGECHQGMPPMLYDTGINFACSDLTSDACKAMHGVPHVDKVEGAQIYKNGNECDNSTVPVASSEQTDWLESFIYTSRNFTGDEMKYTIKLGMSSSSTCDDIGDRNMLTLVVANTTHDVCQGWNHYANAYPDRSDPHQNSATKVTCVDGGVTYSQTPASVKCSGLITKDKREYTTGCHQGFPPTVYIVIEDFSGCEAQGYKPNADGKAYFFPSDVIV